MVRGWIYLGFTRWCRPVPTRSRTARYSRLRVHTLLATRTRVSLVSPPWYFCEAWSEQISRLLPSRSMGQPGINRTAIISFFVDACLDGKPHERLASNICKQTSHRPIRAVCFSFVPLELDRTGAVGTNPRLPMNSSYRLGRKNVEWVIG